MRNCNKMLLISLIIGALVLMTACSLLGNQDSTKHLPKLVDVNLGSDYEIQLISGYPESTLVHVKTNDTYIVSTRLRTYESFHWNHYWRISKKGELLESFATDKRLIFSFAGTSFDATSYNDWPLTGDKSDKTYDRIISSKDIDEKTLNKLFSESEQILWNSFNSGINSKLGEKFCFYLKKQNQWSLLISDKKLFNNPQPAWPPISHLYLNSSTQENSPGGMNEGFLDQKQTESLYPLSSLAWTDVRFTTDKPVVDVIRYKGFDSGYSVSPSFMSQNGWKGKIGKGNLQLLFDKQFFDFKTYTREIPYVNHSEYDPKMRVAHSIPTESQTSFLFLQLTTMGLGDDRDDKEAGIYILKKRNSQDSKTLQPITHIAFKNFHTAPVLRWIIDANGLRNDWPENFLAKDVEFPASLKSLPMYVDFYFTVPKSTSENSRFNLIINDQSWRWENSYSVYAILYIDPDEMADAIKKLGATNLTLSITTEQQDKAIRLIIMLESSAGSIHLNNVRLASKASNT